MAGDDPETSNFCGKKMESFEETSEVSVQFLAGFLYHLWFINCVEHLFYWKSFDESLLWIPEDKNPYFRMSWIGLCNLRRNWWTSWSLLLLLGGVHVGPASWVTSAENPQAILSLSEFVASLNTCLVHIIVQFPQNTVVQTGRDYVDITALVLREMEKSLGEGPLTFQVTFSFEGFFEVTASFCRGNCSVFGKVGEMIFK